MHTTPTVIPLVHLNGTGGKTLLEEYTKAARAVSDAITNVGNITVHGRDYYPISGNALEGAQAEHQLMLNELVSCKKYLEAVAEGIFNQIYS